MIKYERFCWVKAWISLRIDDFLLSKFTSHKSLSIMIFFFILTTRGGAMVLHEGMDELNSLSLYTLYSYYNIKYKGRWLSDLYQHRPSIRYFRTHKHQNFGIYPAHDLSKRPLIKNKEIIFISSRSSISNDFYALIVIVRLLCIFLSISCLIVIEKKNIFQYLPAR